MDKYNFALCILHFALKTIYVNPQSSYFASGNPYTNRKR